MQTHHFSCHEFGFMSFLGMRGDKVRKEKQLEYGENNKQFDQYDKPQGTTDSHIAKTIYIEVCHAMEKIHRQ